VRSPATYLLCAAITAGFGLAGATAHADPFEIRLQSQRALEEITRTQRESIRPATVEAVAAQVCALAVAETRPGEASDVLLAADDARGEAAPLAAGTAPAPHTAQRANKFALPYFSFGRLTSSRRNP
jgi:hypothetical protein